MSDNQMSRRAVLTGAAVTGAALALARGATAAEAARLRMFWWGSQDRARRTFAVADLYHQQTPGVTLAGEAAGGDYFQKLATQVAGRNAPDVFQLEPLTLADYARRGACAPLDPLIPKPLDITDFGQAMRDLCVVDGKTYGVALGLNAVCLFYDTVAFEKAGLPAPTDQTDWTHYADLSVELSKALKPEGKFASPDASNYHAAFEYWLHQRGKLLFKADRTIGFDVDDAQEWFAYWADLRRRGGCCTPDITALDLHQIENSALVLGKAAMSLAYSNQMVGYQGQVRNKLGITTYPAGGPGAKPGHFYRPALIWSVAATSKHKEVAADFIRFFVKDPAAAKVLGVERGVPMSPAIRSLILPDLNPVEQATVQYVNGLADKVGTYPPPPPKGARELDEGMIRPISLEIAFGKMSIADGAKKLVSDAKAAFQG